jgi:SAM-dependent methyltransferase
LKNEIEKNWDEMSKAYENFTENEESYSYAIEWPCIKKILPSLQGKRILDLGCGTGRFDFLFEKENPISILGLDISEEMLNIAKEKAVNTHSKDEWIVRYLDKSKRAYIQPWIEYNDKIKDFLSTSYHHTFGDYLNAIISAGLKIETVEEPYPPEKWKQNNYGRYNSFIETPSYMILKLFK